MRYFTNSPFERLMMEKPCGQSKAADAAWREYEGNERKKRRCAKGRMRERPPQTVDKKGTFGIRKYPFTIISSFSSRQRSPFLSFHVASFFKFMDANKRVS